MYHIIVNPTAGERTKKSLNALETVKQILDKIKAKYIVHKTSYKGEAKEVARSLSAKEENAEIATTENGTENKSENTDIIVIGGDGTLHEVLNGIDDFDKVRLGLIPAGTGNDFAESVKIPENVEDAMDIILHGETKNTNYLQFDGIRSMNVAGLGIDVEVLRRYEKSKKKTKMTYYKCLLTSLMSYKGADLEITTDGEKREEKVFIAAACNGGQFGGGIRICPKYVVDDDKIDLVLVRFVRGVKKLKALMDLTKGKMLQNIHTIHTLCERVSLRSKTPCTVQLDGELYENMPFDVCVGKGLNMFRR